MYVTDTLRGIIGGNHSRYLDWIEPKPRDTRTWEEIAAEVIKNAGVTLVKKGGVV